MSVYYVDGVNGNDTNDGTSGRPWKTLDHAGRRVQSGDTVRVRSAVYHEVLRIRTANTTWQADAGHTPILDGRYDESKKGQGPDGTLPGNKNVGMITLRAAGVTVDGFTIRNVGGCGINGTECSNATIRNCRIDYTYVSGIKISPADLIDNVLVENNVCTRAGIQSFDETATGGKDPGGGVIKVGRARNSIVRGNVCGLSYGEGINIGKGNLGIICEDNEVFLVSHKHIYVNRSEDVVVRGNRVWFTSGHPDIEADDDAPGGIGIGDECGNRPDDPVSSCRNNSIWPKSKRVQIYNNLVVGLGVLLFVSNGTGNRGGGGYDTTLEDCYIGYNTFVAGPRTRQGISLGGNRMGHPHVRSVFENNLIDWRFAPGLAPITAGNGELQGIALRNNLWSTAPPERFRGENDQYGDPHLARSNAPITVSPTNPILTKNFSPNNYKLTSNSVLALNRASSLRPFNELTPPSVASDDFRALRGTQRDIGAYEYIGTGATEAATPGVAEEAEDGLQAVNTLNPPKQFRRFLVMRNNGSDEVAAYGTQFPDMRCVLVWSDARQHINNYDSIEEIEFGNGTSGIGYIVWMDSEP